MSHYVLLFFAGLWLLPGMVLLLRYSRRTRADVRDALSALSAWREQTALQFDELKAKLYADHRLAEQQATAMRDGILEALKDMAQAQRDAIAGVRESQAKLALPLAAPVFLIESMEAPQVAAIARTLRSLRPLVPYPKWRWDADWANPDLAFRMRQRIWQYFNHRTLETSVVVDWFARTQLRLHLGNDLSRQVYIAGCYEPNEFAFLDKLLQPGMNFFDAGAGEGLYTLFAARRVGDTGAVWGFEPSGREFDRLLENLRLNDVGNVHAFRIALADVDGQGELVVADAEHSGQNTLGAFAYDVARELRKEPVPLRRVDHVVSEHDITRLDVLKMDVEGAELRLIEGAHETLSRFRPVILFEALDAALRHQGGGSEALCDALSALGYRLYVFSDDTGLPVPAAPGRFGENMIAIPAERSLPEAVFGLAPSELAEHR